MLGNKCASGDIFATANEVSDTVSVAVEGLEAIQLLAAEISIQMLPPH
jgi:hypothetical protein